LAGGSPARRREFLGGLEQVVIDVERGAHELIITHHASDVKGMDLAAGSDPAGVGVSLR